MMEIAELQEIDDDQVTDKVAISSSSQKMRDWVEMLHQMPEIRDENKCLSIISDRALAKCLLEKHL